LANLVILTADEFKDLNPLERQAAVGRLASGLSSGSSCGRSSNEAVRSLSWTSSRPRLTVMRRHSMMPWLRSTTRI
jgi:hypothetical protein